MRNNHTTVSKTPTHLRIEQWYGIDLGHVLQPNDTYCRADTRRVIRNGVEEVQIELEVGKVDSRKSLRSQYSSLILTPAQAAQLVKALTEVVS